MAIKNSFHSNRGTDNLKMKPQFGDQEYDNMSDHVCNTSGCKQCSLILLRFYLH